MEARVKPAHDERYSLRRAQRHRNRLDAGKIELARRGIDIEPDHVTIGVEIDIEPLDNLPRLGTRHVLQLDIEAVGLRIIVQLHGPSSRKLRSKNALWTVSPSANVTTLAESLIGLFFQDHVRPYRVSNKITKSRGIVVDGTISELEKRSIGKASELAHPAPPMPVWGCPAATS